MISDFVCFGRGKPRITSGEDRWGRTTRRLTTNGYGYVDRVMWEKLQAYQSPIEMTDEDKEESAALQKKLLDVSSPEARDSIVSVALAASSLARRIESMMELAGRKTTIWEFNASVDNPALPKSLEYSEYIRFFAVLGDPQLVEWNFFDLKVHQFFVWFVRVYNYFLCRYFLAPNGE